MRYQVRWYGETVNPGQDDQPRHYYNYLIIGENGVTGQIEQKIKEILKPIENHRSLLLFDVKGTDTRVRLSSVDSFSDYSPDEINFSSVCNYLVERDEILRNRGNPSGLLEVIEEYLRLGKFP
ncbi:MAG: hypothetical protein KC506_02975 [Nanoarchaeota archaeon]|nr:hypothetical protein [Nanoarchaeota archaeon]